MPAINEKPQQIFHSLVWPDLNVPVDKKWNKNETKIVICIWIYVNVGRKPKLHKVSRYLHSTVSLQQDILHHMHVSCQISAFPVANENRACCLHKMPVCWINMPNWRMSSGHHCCHDTCLDDKWSRPCCFIGLPSLLAISSDETLALSLVTCKISRMLYCRYDTLHPRWSVCRQVIWPLGSAHPHCLSTSEWKRCQSPFLQVSA